jgi:type II secretory pathway pseudopilin PulG
VTSSKTAKPGRSGGYSLVELVLVLACATTLLAAAVPNIVGLQREWTLWGAARVLEASLQWGRMHAIASNTPVVFRIDDAQQKFYWADAVSGDFYVSSERHLPAGVRFAAVPGRPLRFYQHGNAAPAGTYTLAGGAGSYSVVVSPGGRIRIQKN